LFQGKNQGYKRGQDDDVDVDDDDFDDGDVDDGDVDDDDDDDNETGFVVDVKLMSRHFTLSVDLHEFNIF
jgi:hypothetical protein